MEKIQPEMMVYLPPTLENRMGLYTYLNPLRREKKKAHPPRIVHNNLRQTD